MSYTREQQKILQKLDFFKIDTKPTDVEYSIVPVKQKQHAVTEVEPARLTGKTSPVKVQTVEQAEKTADSVDLRGGFETVVQLLTLCFLIFGMYEMYHCVVDGWHHFTNILQETKGTSPCDSGLDFNGDEFMDWVGNVVLFLVILVSCNIAVCISMACESKD